MNVIAQKLHSMDLHRLQQVFKWTVYTLLVVNFGFYIVEDADRAIHTLGPGASLLQWAGEFATSIDTLAWFALLFMFELETYLIDDENWSRRKAIAIHGVRLVAYAMIAHTVFAYSDTVVDYSKTTPLEGLTSLCEIAGQDYSHVYNLDYSEITVANCGKLSEASNFYRLGEDKVVTSREGLALERRLAWFDVLEAIVWLVIIAAIEVIVRLQNRNVTGGPLRTTANRVKMVCYSILFFLAVYCGRHWLLSTGCTTWDTALWVGGFAVIEMNVNEWRDEILSGLRTAGRAD